MFQYFCFALFHWVLYSIVFSVARLELHVRTAAKDSYIRFLTNGPLSGTQSARNRSHNDLRKTIHNMRRRQADRKSRKVRARIAHFPSVGCKRDHRKAGFHIVGLFWAQNKKAFGQMFGTPCLTRAFGHPIIQFFRFCGANFPDISGKVRNMFSLC